MKDWFKRNYKRVWVTGVGALGFGLLVDIVGSAIFGGVHDYVQFGSIVAGGITLWFVLKNNNGFGKV